MIRPANPDPGPSGDPTPSRVGHACSAHLRIGEAGDQEHRCRVAAANRVMATPLSCIHTELIKLEQQHLTVLASRLAQLPLSQAVAGECNDASRGSRRRCSREVT